MSLWVILFHQAISFGLLLEELAGILGNAILVVNTKIFSQTFCLVFSLLLVYHYRRICNAINLNYLYF